MTSRTISQTVVTEADMKRRRELSGLGFALLIVALLFAIVGSIGLAMRYAPAAEVGNANVVEFLIETESLWVLGFYCDDLGECCVTVGDGDCYVIPLSPRPALRLTLDAQLASED